MSHQDWETITIFNKDNKRNGYPLEKVSGTQAIRVKQTGTSAELRKLETAETGKPKMLTPQSRTALAAARVAKGLTQKQLDQQGAFPLNSTNMWESGKICPTSQQIQALHRILQVKLERA
jgi:ribosome-binding protein aMBF1 (putative translation factor)